MDSLRERLDAIRRTFETQAPKPVLDVLHRATRDLEESGAVERALGEGAEAPSFELANSLGEIVRSEDLLAEGRLVLTFFRGHW